MRSPFVAFLVRFVLVAALLLTWALGIGRYGGPDEPAHVLRSFAAAHGDVLGDAADPLPAGYRIVSVPASLATGDPACYRHDARLTSACAASEPSASEGSQAPSDTVRVATSAGLTPPLYHWLVGTLVRVVGDPADTAWYRAVAALLHAAVLALALTRLRRRPLQTALVIAIVTPAAWFLFGVVNPNSIEIALALLGWVGVSKLLDGEPPARADAWWTAMPMAVAVVVRPIAIVPAIAMLLTLQLRGRLGRHRWIVTAPLGVAVALSIAWNLAVDVQVDDPRTAVHRSFLANVGDALGSLHLTARESVDSLGWNEFRAPLVALVLWMAVWLAIVACIVVGAVVAHRQGERTAWRAPAAWVLTLIATPVLFEVALASSVGPIWQGRYSLPMLVGLPVFVSAPVLPRWLGTARALVVVPVAAAAAETITYWATVRRAAVGSHGSWWLDDAFRSTAWLGPRTWLVVHAAIVAMCLGLIVRAARVDRTMSGQTM